MEECGVRREERIHTGLRKGVPKVACPGISSLMRRIRCVGQLISVHNASMTFPFPKIVLLDFELKKM
jgi:hypothetical protein